MKQIEITTKVNNKLDEAIEILENQGFKKIRESRVEDKYLTQNIDNLTKDNIMQILSTCVLLRYLRANGEIFKKITYKNKIIDNGKVISEEKINLNCEDLEQAKNLFRALNFKELVNVNYDVIVMAKDNIEFAFQEVEGLGLLLEYENVKDFSLFSNEEIISEKNNMLNQVKKYGLSITNDYDVKKAFELIKLNM